MSAPPPMLPGAPPPGSMRWQAQLYAPAAARPALLALCALEDELRNAASPRIDHGVAHAKLQWWREEIERLAAGTPRHPLAQAAAGAAAGRPVRWQRLQEFVTALELDLACATLESAAELDRYLALSGSALQALWSEAAGCALDAAATDRLAAAAGASIRAVELIRDLRQDAWEGRIRLPLDWLDEAGVAHAQLGEEDPGQAARDCLARLAALSRAQWQQALAALGRPADPALRGQRVLGELHQALLGQIERGGFFVGRERIALGPVRSMWVAWRSARRH